MIRKNDIRGKLLDFLAHSLSLDEFEDWLVPNSWNMHKDTDEETQQFVGEIELRLSEHSSGHLDSDDLRYELQMILIHGTKLPQGNMVVIQPLPLPETFVVARTIPSPEPESILLGGPVFPTNFPTYTTSGRSVTSLESMHSVA